jgi:hypothetical protein
VRTQTVLPATPLFFLGAMDASIGRLVLDEQMPPLAWVGLALAVADAALADRLPDLSSRLSICA